MIIFVFIWYVTSVFVLGMMWVVCLLFLPGVVLGNQYVRQPYSSDSEFNQQVKFGDDASLECKDRFILTSPDEFKYWILPNNMVLQPGNTYNVSDPIDKLSVWTVTGDGSRINLTNIREAHFGVYHCVMVVSSTLRTVKVGLNYNGPYFGNLWTIYRRNVMIGGIASAVFLVIAATLYTIYKLRYRGEEEEEEQMRAYLSNSTSRYDDLILSTAQPDGHQNAAYDKLAYNKEAAVGTAHPAEPYRNPAYLKDPEDTTQL